MKLSVHPAAEIFPMLGKVALRELSEDIAENGLQQAITIQGDMLLDGRNRLAACELAGVKPEYREYEGDSPVSFIIGANLHRRHLDQSQKAAIGVEIEPFFEAEARKREEVGRPKEGKVKVPYLPSEKGQSRDQAAKAVGVSGTLVSAAKAIKKQSPETFKKIKDGILKVGAAKKQLKAVQDMADLEKAQKNITKDQKESLESVCDLRVCSCAELFASGIKPDAVITDPPYPVAFLPLFTELAESCAKAGVPLVAVMSGQSYLPEVMRRLCEHLEYRWMLAYLTPGGQAVQQWQAKVNTAWKPVILFGKGKEWFGDVAVSKINDNDKRFHGWGQSESGMADLVDRLTKPGQLICDPFLGGGTTALVSLAMGRKFVGCDIDPGCVAKTKKRVEAQASCQK